jgi:hypothetical protein
MHPNASNKMTIDFKQVAISNGRITCHARITVWICLLVASLGCGRKDQVPVAGTVSWKGEPVQTGYITFVSAPLVAAGSGPIEAGQFKFVSKLGTVSVRITASREGKFDPSERTMGREQYIPARYNRDTELTAEVTLDGENQFDFALTP